VGYIGGVFREESVGIANMHYNKELMIIFNAINETEEKENQVFGNILSLLVCPFCLSGGWNSEIPNIG
jgi:hypothetical protein